MYRQADLSLQAGIAQNNSNVWGINSTALETSINQADTLAFSFCLYISVFWPDWSQDLYFTTRLYIKKGLGDFFYSFDFIFSKKFASFSHSNIVYIVLFPSENREMTHPLPPPIEWNCSICHYWQLVIVDIKWYDLLAFSHNVITYRACVFTMRSLIFIDILIYFLI